MFLKILKHKLKSLEVNNYQYILNEWDATFLIGIGYPQSKKEKNWLEYKQYIIANVFNLLESGSPAFDEDKIYKMINDYSTSVERNPRITQISELINFNYELKKPIEVKLIYDGFDIIGTIDELELYSWGDNEFIVLRELNEDITDLFTKLISISNDKLGKYPKKWKFILNKYIRNAQ